MALDMEHLRKIFYEECRENLQVLESVLLDLNPDQYDDESINTIFRAAHSIKGGAATFNLNDISEFTHSVEAYLDRVRNGKRRLSGASVDCLLRGVDGIRSMLAGHEYGEPVNEDVKQSVTAELAQWLETSLSDSENRDWPGVLDGKQCAFLPDVTTDDASTWSVQFVPKREIFFSGNDPLRILRELRELNHDCRIILDSSQLPETGELDPELCYLSWQCFLPASVAETDIREVFEWVEDECDLVVVLLPECEPLQQERPAFSAESVPEGRGTSPVPKSELPDSPAIIEAEPQAKSAKFPRAEQNLNSIRVDIEKVDNLINLVGELVITQSMLTEIGNDFSMDKLERLQAGLAQLLQNSKDLQENVLNIRMLPMSFAFSRFPRLVRDLSQRLGKQVALNIRGENTELDKTVLERIVDPLVHLVRNGIDHGIENPARRRELGKPEQGTLDLNAYHQGGSIIIEVRDDGAGIDGARLWEKARQKGVVAADSRREEMSDKQILNLIFAPGFSMAEQVSDISGRGVGMDVVKRNIEELGGHIDVESQINRGCLFTICLPLTLAILDGQLVKVGGQVYVIPLLTIVESIQVRPERIKHASGGVELYRLREENIPLVRLLDELEMGPGSGLDQPIICFVEAAGNRIGLLVDELLEQQQVVIKSLESNYTKVPGISGATILGDGSVSLILDIQGIITGFFGQRLSSSAGSQAVKRSYDEHGRRDLSA